MFGVGLLCVTSDDTSACGVKVWPVLRMVCDATFGISKISCELQLITNLCVERKSMPIIGWLTSAT